MGNIPVKLFFNLDECFWGRFSLKYFLSHISAHTFNGSGIFVQFR